MSRVAKNVYAVDCDDFNGRFDPLVGHAYFLDDRDGGTSPVFAHLWHALTTGRVEVEQGSRTKVL